MELAGQHGRIIAGAACVIITLAGAGAGQAGRTTPAYGAATVAARTVLQTIGLGTTAVAATAAVASASASEAGTGGGAGGTRWGTRPFSLIGATWSDPAVVLDATVQVRTHDVAGGRWTGWITLDADGPSAADSGAEGATSRGSTDPLWVGDSDGVEGRVIAGSGRTGVLPAGLRLDLIDPDAVSPADAAASAQAVPTPTITPKPTVTPTPTPTVTPPQVVVPGRPVPTMVGRAGWNANDRIVEHSPDYTSDVQALFVHHTAGSNSYHCADSPAIVRSIQAYHVNSKHWNDIGYNFLVDKCGTLFEGRAGGITRPVLGAHTLGFNAHAAGIAVIGDYSATPISPAARRSIAQIAAYKIGMYGNDPAGTVTLTSAGSGKYADGVAVRLARVSGHRDAVPTACPGNSGYAQLASLRDLATGPVADLGVSRLAGSSRVGQTFYTRGVTTVSWSTSTPTTMIDRFDVVVDSLPAVSAPSGHRSAVVRLAPGRHTLSVRAVHLSGRTSSTGTYTFIADRTAPVFAADPVLNLRSGSLLRSVPVTLGWQVTDPGGLRGIAATSPAATSFDASTARWNTTAPLRTATTWAVSATDRAGNEGAASVVRTPILVSEASAARTGRWSTQRDPAHLGGVALRSATAGSTLSWSFTGRAASLAVARTARSGRMAITVDGRLVASIDLRSASTATRQAIWAYNWRVRGEHTVSISVQGTAGRPDVTSDGLVYLR